MFYGVTSGGGSDGIGTIFSASIDGSSLQVEYSFETMYPGSYPFKNKLIQATNGKLYGMIAQGAAANKGDYSKTFHRKELLRLIIESAF